MKTRENHQNFVEWISRSNGRTKQKGSLKNEQTAFSLRFFLLSLFCAIRMSEDLNRLITLTSQQVKPFIFVGSDLGAIIARFYTQIYERYITRQMPMRNFLVELLF